MMIDYNLYIHALRNEIHLPLKLNSLFATHFLLHITFSCYVCLSDVVRRVQSAGRRSRGRHRGDQRRRALQRQLLRHQSLLHHARLQGPLASAHYVTDQVPQERVGPCQK